MLDRLRFQEMEKAVFKARENMKYGNRCVEKDEPILIIDNAQLSEFIVGSEVITNTGRSTISETANVRSIDFTLSNGQISLNLFNNIFGRTSFGKESVFTINKTILLNNSDNFLLPELPTGDVLLYLTDDYGNLTKIAKDQYSIEEQKVIFIKEVSHLITYVFQTKKKNLSRTDIKQLGTHLITSLEMQCTALDTLTEEKLAVLIKFDKVSVGVGLDITFNTSKNTSQSLISVSALVEDGQSEVNKDLFTIEVM